MLPVQVAIKVIGFDGAERHVLGRFELVGIAPGRVGSAQVQISFSLSDDGGLHVTASDRTGGAGSRGIYIRDQSLTPTSNAPVSRTVGAIGYR